MKKNLPSLIIILLFTCCGSGNSDITNGTIETAEAGEKNLPHINLPDGFNIEIYAENVVNARGMTLGDNGTLFVGSKSEGKVYALVDKNNDYKPDEVYTIAKGLNQPVGLAFKDGDLYISAISDIVKLKDIEANLNDPPDPVIVYDQFPSEKHHGWKYIAFGPDEKLYVPVGAPCNICESEEIFSSITRMEPDGSNLEIYAHGIRNTVGFDWHPVTNELWFTENGRDWLGDDRPPDELNYAPQKGMHFGYPYCHGGTIEDPEFGDKRDCEEFTPPVQNLGPHVAALGMKFYNGKMFPEEYHNQIFIAEHGSWNRSTKIGYRITLVKLDGNKSLGYEVFADGWEDKGHISGRPVDLLILPDGSMLISDDYGNKIYRITYAR